MLGVFRPKTANAIGLPPTRRLLCDFPRGLESETSVIVGYKLFPLCQTPLPRARDSPTPTRTLSKVTCPRIGSQACRRKIEETATRCCHLLSDRDPGSDAGFHHFWHAGRDCHPLAQMASALVGTLTSGTLLRLTDKGRA